MKDADIANLCSDIYSQPSAFDKIIEADKVYLGIKDYPDCTAVIMRGSVTLLDWVRDLEAVSLISDPSIGLVPLGFHTGIPEALEQLSALDTIKPFVLGGHSLGAAHAAQLGGIILSRGAKITKTVLLGCPTPGGEKLRFLWSGSTVVSYKNLSDPVTDVPILPSLRHICDFTPLSITPVTPDPWGVFADHHIQYYCAGVQRLNYLSGGT